MILCAALGVCSLVIFIPQVRELIIALGEKYVGRPLTHSAWHARFIKWEIMFLIASAVFVCFFAFSKSFPLKFEKNINGMFHVRRVVTSVLSSRTHGAEILLIFAVCVGVRAFFIGQKKRLHVDEALSISICNRNEYGFWGKPYERNTECTGKELKSMSLWDDASIRDSVRDVIAMHKNNRDSPHTNFYYSLFRLWFTGAKTSDLKQIFIRGGILNIVFFTFSFFFMILLLLQFTTDRFKICLCLAIAFLNPAALSLTVFLRPYELQQVLVIIVTYYVACVLKSFSENAIVMTKKNFIIGTFTLALTLLSAYFNFILVGLYGLALIVISLRKKNFFCVTFFIYMFICSLVVAKILYFGFGEGLFTDRGTEAFSKLSFEFFIKNAKGTIGYFGGNFKSISFSVAFIVSAFLFVFYARKNKSLEYITITSAIVLTIFLVTLFSPYKTLRYIAPFAAVLAVICAKDTRNFIINYTLPSAVALFVCVSVFPAFRNPARVEHVDDTKIARYKEIQESEFPIFVRGLSVWKYGCLIPYLSDESTVIFVDDFSEIEEKYPDKIPCLFIDEGEANQHETFVTNCQLKKQSSVPYYEVFLVRE